MLSDDDDCCTFEHKGNKVPPRPNATNSPHTLVGCDIEPTQHQAILLERGPRGRATAEWGVVKVVSRPVAAASSHTFTAFVLDYILRGKVVVRAGSACANSERWVPRRDRKDFGVATALCNVNVSPLRHTKPACKVHNQRRLQP